MRGFFVAIVFSILKQMNLFKKHSCIFLTALALNLIWEFSHYRLYVDTSAIQGSPHLLIASLFDAIFILSIFGVISLKHRSLNWIHKPSKMDYGALMFMAFVIAILIEVVNLHLGRWSYTVAMPTLFGIGLSPLVQLALTGMLTLNIVKRIVK